MDNDVYERQEKYFLDKEQPDLVGEDDILTYKCFCTTKTTSSAGGSKKL